MLPHQQRWDPRDAGVSQLTELGAIFCYIIRVGNANNLINPTILSEEFEIQNLIM